MTDMMKSFLSCFIILLLALCLHLPVRLSSAAPSKLDEVCNRLADFKEFDVTPDHCRFVFQRDPWSRTAEDDHALGLILVNITMKAATKAISGMTHAILHTNNSLNQEEKRAGLACIHRYRPAIPALQAMTKSLTIRDYEKARDDKFEAWAAEGNCEDEVKADEDLGVTPYLSKYRINYWNAVYLLDAMAELLVKTYCAHS